MTHYRKINFSVFSTTEVGTSGILNAREEVTA
jgi:hypothetical protein